MDKYLKPVQIARYYDVSVQTIDAWSRSGKLAVALTTPSGRKRYLNPEWKEEEARA